MKPADPRSPTFEATLRGLRPLEELAFRYAFHASNPYCHGDARWRDRIAEMERGLSPAQRRATHARARELESGLSAAQVRAAHRRARQLEAAGPAPSAP